MKRMILVCWLCLVATYAYAGGDWVADKKTGCQVWSHSSLPNEAITWSGECNNGKAYGKGTAKWYKDKKIVITIEGTMDNGRCQHECSFAAKGGNKYLGELQDNIPSGKVTILFPNNWKYVGYCKNGIPHGHGTLVYSDGKGQYTGEWKNGKRDGKGEQTLPDGLKYIGDFKNDNFHGNGIVTYQTGDRYFGSWIEGKEHGKGTYTFKDGTSYEGLWEHGKRIKIF